MFTITLLKKLTQLQTMFFLRSQQPSLKTLASPLAVTLLQMRVNHFQYSFRCNLVLREMSMSRSNFLISTVKLRPGAAFLCSLVHLYKAWAQICRQLVLSGIATYRHFISRWTLQWQRALSNLNYRQFKIHLARQSFLGSKYQLWHQTSSGLSNQRLVKNCHSEFLHPWQLMPVTCR